MECYDGTGEIIEELIKIKNLVCLNDELAIDLTLVSERVAGRYNWKVIKQTTIGSDHYPIMTEVGMSLKSETLGVDGFLVVLTGNNLRKLVMKKCKRLMLIKKLMN